MQLFTKSMRHETGFKVESVQVLTHGRVVPHPCNAQEFKHASIAPIGARDLKQEEDKVTRVLELECSLSNKKMKHA